MVRTLFLVVLAVTAAACASKPPPATVVVAAATPVVVPATPRRLPPAFNPAAEYVTAGQDEPGYQSWILARPERAAQVAGFDSYLQSRGVSGVIPTWQLLRTASMWKKCAADPFEVPPADHWPNLVETLGYVRSHVIPVVGQVEAVSVYRNPELNRCAGGAAESAHRHFFALDLVPLRPTKRDALMRGLCAIHAWQGTGYDVGLGFYKGLRFHVDSKSYRKWGAALGDERTIGCPQVMATIAAEAAAAKAAIAARAAQAAPDTAAPPAPAPAEPTTPQ